MSRPQTDGLPSLFSTEIGSSHHNTLPQIPVNGNLASLEHHRSTLSITPSPHRLSLESIEEASRVIDPVFRRSPQYLVEPLSDILGCRLTVKAETINPIRSFKGRGADYFLHRMAHEAKGRRLVCASAGNFGQAMAYVCRKHGRSLTVYAGETANTLKIARMRALGADVRLAGPDFDAAKAEAKRDCEQTGAWMVEDGLEPAISEGAGTIAVELHEREDTYDAVAVPLGNGALLTGMGRWIKAVASDTQVIGVSSSGADAMARSWREGRIVVNDRVDTIADGIGVRVPIPEAVADMRGVVDDVVLVDDHTIIEAMRLIHTHVGLVVEPAGAAGLAAILDEPSRFSGLRVATVLAGGNLTEDQMARWLLP